MMQVQEIWRYPVKSMQGESLSSAPVDEFGIRGDRGWALVDAETGLALTARREPQLLFGSARVLPGGDGSGLDVVITLPDGSETNDDGGLSAWIGRPVTLQRARPEQFGTYETQADDQEVGDWFQWSGPQGSYHDSTRTRISLATEDAYREWDPRRFRINVTLGGSGDVGLVGSQIEIGAVTVDVLKRIDRCVMTTRPQPASDGRPALERDLSVLRTINKENDTFLGVGALVVTGGMFAVGDEVIVG